MNSNRETDDLFRTSHSILLIGYSILVILHVIVNLMFGWEKWALIPVVAGLVAAWYMHLKQLFTEKQRLWLTASFMMCAFFIFGAHPECIHDLASVMASMIMLFIMTRERGVITLCQITFYATLLFDIITMAADGEDFSANTITRILINFAVITVVSAFVKATISKWKQVSDASDEEIEKLTDSARRLNDFLANVSHELRTPVNAVIGLSGICLDRKSSPEMKKDLAEINNAGHRVANQISDILDFSEMDKGDLVKNCEDYILISLINDLMIDFQKINTGNIELVIDIDPMIPAVMNTDVSKLKKIILALVSNGLKFTEEGGVRLKIYAEKQVYGVNLLIEVADTGCGMSEEEIERVYDSFYQADSSRARKTGGLGLGLSLVSGFVSLLGGFMVIESTEGKGTTVNVSLPQTIVSDVPCMSLEDPKKIVACVFMNDGVTNPFIREYYNLQLKTLVSGLGIDLLLSENINALKKLSSEMTLTHLFVGTSEYRDNREFIESMADQTVITVICEKDYVLPSDSRAKLMVKPFSGLAFTNILKSDSSNTGAGNLHLKTKNVHALVVDDESMNLIVAKSIFKRYNIEVSTAISGSQSIEMCRDHVYNLIFMDHMMSGMDGVEAMKKIRSDVHGLNRETPVIALTANAMSSARQMFAAEGFDGFVSKPIDFEELERTLKKLLPKDMITYEKESETPAPKKPAAKKPEPGNEVLEFGSNKDEAMEFSPADEAMEFSPADDVMEFSPDEDVMEFSPDDEVFEFSPDEDGDEDSVSVSELVNKLDLCGINATQSLEYYAGDGNLYLKIAFGFAIEIDKRIKTLNEYLANRDWKNYEVLIHSTKSTSKMIGAMSLSEHAMSLERAASEGDEEYISSNHEAVMAECSEVAERIISAAGSRELAVKLAES